MKRFRAVALSLLAACTLQLPMVAEQKAPAAKPAAAAPLSFELLLSHAQQSKTAGRLLEAERLTRQALAMAEAKKDTFGVIMATNTMAGVMRWQGKQKEALAMYQKVEKLLQDAKETNSVSMATVLDNQATVLDDMREFSQAATVRKDAIKIYEAAGPSHDLAMVYANQASNLMAQRKTEEGEVAAQKAIAMYKQTGDAEGPDMAVAMDTLAGIYNSQKKYAEAEALQRKVLPMLEKAYGPSSPDVSISLDNLANTLMFLKKYEEAKKLMARSLEICKKVYGPTHQKTQEVQARYTKLSASTK